jgi:hypothetical protein
VEAAESHGNHLCTSSDELFSGLTECGRYNHLRLILSKTDNLSLGQRYLMVNKTSFGLVRLCDVDFDDNHVYFNVQMTKRVGVDISDPAFSFLFISWRDVRMMMLAEDEIKLISDDLLEFDF